MADGTEARIRQIVEELAMKPVALDEPLLDGNLIDSITAVDLALRIEQEFQVPIAPHEITEHMKTMRSLVSFVLKHR